MFNSLIKDIACFFLRASLSAADDIEHITAWIEEFRSVMGLAPFKF